MAERCQNLQLCAATTVGLRGGIVDEHNTFENYRSENDAASTQHSAEAEHSGSCHPNLDTDTNARSSSAPPSTTPEVSQLDANIQDSSTHDIPEIDIGEPVLATPLVPAIHIPRHLLQEEPESGVGFRSTPVQGANLGSPLPLDVARLRQQLDVQFDLNGTIDSGIGSSLNDSVQNADVNVSEVTTTVQQAAAYSSPKGIPAIPTEEESYFNLRPRDDVPSSERANNADTGERDSLLRRGSRRISLATNILWNRVHQMFPGGVVTTSEPASRRSTIDHGRPFENLEDAIGENQPGPDHSIYAGRFPALQNVFSRIGSRTNRDSLQQSEERHDDASEDENLDMVTSPPARSGRMRRALNRSLSLFTSADASAPASQRGSVSTYGTGTMPMTPEIQTPSTIRRTLSWLSIFPSIATTAPPSREGPIYEDRAVIGGKEGTTEPEIGLKKGKAKPSFMQVGSGTLRLPRRLRKPSRETAGTSEANNSHTGAILNPASTAQPDDGLVKIHRSQDRLTEEGAVGQAASQRYNHDENTTTTDATEDQIQSAEAQSEDVERTGQNVQEINRLRGSLRRIGSHLHPPSWGKSATKVARKVVYKQQNILPGL